jgi:hypothetical protein
MQKKVQRDDKEAPSFCKQKSWQTWTLAGRKKRNAEVTEWVVHPRGDIKYAEAAENGRDIGAT